MQMNNEQTLNQDPMVALRQSIEAFLYRFDELVEKYGFKPSYKALRRQYCDTCCKGDAVINIILDGLNDPDSQYYVKFMEEQRVKEDAEFTKRLIDEYLMYTLDTLDENNLELELFY